MKILDRYLVVEFVKPFIYCLVFLALTLTVIDCFNNLEEFIRHQVHPAVVGYYYLALLPITLVRVTPIATMVSLLYLLGHLNHHNEIIAMRASGIGFFSLMIPFLISGLLLSFVVFLTNEKVVPRASITSAAIMEGLVEKGRRDFKGRSLKNVTLYGRDNRMIFAKEFELATNTLYDVAILEHHPDHTLRSRINAKKAVFKNNQWTFYDCGIYPLDSKGDAQGESRFEKEIVFPLPERPDDFIKEGSETEFMSMKELKDYKKKLSGGSGKGLSHKFAVEYNHKLAFPFVNFILVLLAVPIGLGQKKGSTLSGIGVSFALTFVYYGLLSVCLALGKKGFFHPFLAAWFANFVVGGIGIYLIKKQV